MAFINLENFKEAQPSQLSLFDLPPTQTAVEKLYFQEVRPISQLSSSSPIEFTISGQNGMEYIDLRNSFICVKVRIVKADGSHLGSTEYVGPVNLFLQAMFTQVDVSVQGRTVTSATGHYSYKAMIQTLLGYGSNAKKSQLTAQMWYKDTAGYLDDDDVNAGQNTGLYERGQFFARSKTVDMIGPIAHDLFKLDRYIPNQVGVSVKFYRSKPQFCLMTNELAPDFDVCVEDMMLKICKVKINPAVIYAHAQTLQHKNAKFPFVKSDVRMMALAQGQVDLSWDNVFQGMRPNKVVIGFVNSQAVAGTYNLNPWNFQNYDLSQINVSVDGIPAEGNPMKLNFDNTNGTSTANVLVSMLQSSGKFLRDEGNGLDRSDVNSGFALFAFDLEPSFEERNYLTLIKQGNVRIDAQFGKSLPHPVTCIVYSEGSGYFELNFARDVILE